MKNLQMIFISIIFSILLIPMLGLNYHDKISVRENRKLAEKPCLICNGKINGKFFNALNAFLQDRFGGREQLIKINSKIYYDFLGFDQMKGRAVVGKDGWYFHLGYGMNYDILKTNLISDAEKQAFIGKIKEITDWLKENDIKPLFLICPEKHSVYSEKLPVKRPEGITRTDQIVECIESLGVDVIFPRDYMIEKKACTPISLYLETDTHWNKLGAYYTFQLIKEKIREMFPEVCIPDWNYTVQNGTHIGPSDARLVLGLEEGINTYPRITSDDKHYSVLNDKGVKECVHTVGTDQRLPRILVLRDSFTEFLISFLSDISSEAIYIWRGYPSGKNFSYSQILEFKPDLVIFESVERFIFSIVEKDNRY